MVKIFFKEFKKDWKKLPNIITEFRLIFSPFPGLMILFFPDDINIRIVAMILLAIVAATDFIDGRLARKLNQETLLGKTLDPMVDKVLAGLTLIALCIRIPRVFMLSFAIFVFVRGAFLAPLLYKAKKYEEEGKEVTSIYSGKISSALLSVTMILYFFFIKGWGVLPVALIIFIIIISMVTVAFSIYSWVEYIKIYSKNSKFNERSN